MTVRTTELAGVYLLEPQTHTDERGSFETLFDDVTLAKCDFGASGGQVALSRNVRERTLRGLHYQTASHPQQKLVTCVRGRIFDVVVDVRATSPTVGAWLSIELGPGGPTVAVPSGCAHGYLTLEPDSDVLYHLSARGERTAERGLRWDDPSFPVRWPTLPHVVSDRDLAWPPWVRGFPSDDGDQASSA